MESKKVVERALDAVSALDMTTVAELFAEDGVLELPNRADGPRTLTGRDEIAPFLGLLPQVLTEMPLVDRRYHETTDPSVVIAEYRSEGTTVAGRPYRNRYVGVFEIDAAGRIARWREYFDPLAVTEAFGPEPTG